MVAAVNEYATLRDDACDAGNACDAGQMARADVAAAVVVAVACAENTSTQ